MKNILTIVLITFFATVSQAFQFGSYTFHKPRTLLSSGVDFEVRLFEQDGRQMDIVLKDKGLCSTTKKLTANDYQYRVWTPPDYTSIQGNVFCDDGTWYVVTIFVEETAWPNEGETVSAELHIHAMDWKVLVNKKVQMTRHANR